MKKEKVIVGLSGGVDSSVAALLLQREGYEVEGFFMRNWDSAANNDFLGNNDDPNEACTQEQDYQDALKVANKLGIKLHRVDFIQEYWDNVFQYFLDEYEKGRTPNPDILCNKYIKFDAFAKYAFEKLGADYIAMGHYAGTRYNPETKQVELIRAADDNKDQTYFLCQLTQDQISRTLFPLQPFKKPEVRELAKENDLITAEKKDSTGICFIGERNFTEFLQNYIPNQPGDIVNIKTNEVIGKHIGVMYYTIGQRKGLNLGGQPEPMYVAKKDVKNKIIYVAPASDQSYLLSNSALITGINWNIELDKYVDDINEFNCTAKFRYRQKDENVKMIRQENGDYLVKYDNVKSVTEGQEAVFYLDDICLGGGVIENVYK
ncbi:tRNA 2-thiouridine(34) synthase MnmA [Mesoplasma lactucae]|uniref:tRNA-specific 2-thiouridylase MnmA n=1 Tax=Mesoplasma lactucae ATCC 49193 TaxID=81460 RepID=A0A291IRL6_9MOLU|nr:tRNA 2-thiouridine(34) synthase MnmA [Mesoplasma lactucae]ATG97337.1 tRNA 2-thiouridine(34) synthase MnmA [Mesoplasma lactucae ATCC 49193]ATZ20211.1 tRNA 2-thiouridine(34) synthase MnmA [Mesoplasma lactucae ATCC 49193]MCL8216960.1 tRNA-specific 2-thiouridylase MnmA [Mesoplasma lactucae ATCC 49193]